MGRREGEKERGSGVNGIRKKRDRRERERCKNYTPEPEVMYYKS